MHSRFNVFQRIIQIGAIMVYKLILILKIRWLYRPDFDFVESINGDTFCIEITIVFDFGPIFIIDLFPNMQWTLLML